MCATVHHVLHTCAVLMALQQFQGSTPFGAINDQRCRGQPIQSNSPSSNPMLNESDHALSSSKKVTFIHSSPRFFLCLYLDIVPHSPSVAAKATASTFIREYVSIKSYMCQEFPSDGATSSCIISSLHINLAMYANPICLAINMLEFFAYLGCISHFHASRYISASASRLMTLQIRALSVCAFGTISRIQRTAPCNCCMQMDIVRGAYWPGASNFRPSLLTMFAPKDEPNPAGNKRLYRLWLTFGTD
ncbi:uncharacterized protein BT62DRAFT_1002215 [Guyanagaster necrorhizus]|uniref:Secreted protein n=1 Tax=Guyanagaster necrorhizus TaxID=856835 RepID=A0A9P7W200_9AGAR|nr:uncharacterized protein BT62DRAFT_1002215 [Guyanagaster necrorhizus MCA 3950]KAG7449906.1 hypothetical protein BT62DRAFT_1002215 [Guyanagaster necrorhizus MCA 3950]